MKLEDPSFEYLPLFKEEKTSKANPFQVLLRLYHGQWAKLILSLLVYIIKSSPTWVLPMVTANVINIATKPENHTVSELWVNFIVIVLVILQNIPMHTVHVAFFSKALRHVEAGLRSTLVRKLQQLSIGFYGDLGAGRIQTKVLRDVEAIEMSLRQLMLGLMPALINLTAHGLEELEKRGTFYELQRL